MRAYRSQVGGNYAPTIKISESAAKKGFTQVLWLFGDQKEVRISARAEVRISARAEVRISDRAGSY